MSFRVVLDACVLVPSLLCDVLLHLAEDDLYDPLWSAQILDETRRTLVGNSASISSEPSVGSGRCAAPSRPQTSMTTSR